MAVARALLIGNSTFPDDPHNLPELRGPVNDLTLLRNALTDPEVGVFQPGNVRLMAERTRREIATAIEELLRRASADDLVLLYYSGHGKRDEYDHLYLCGRDTRADLLLSTAISDADINNMIRGSAAKTLVIVLDCCYSGAFKGGGIAERLHGQGRFVIASSRHAELSADAVEASGASPFTGCLVEAIELGTLEANGSGYISLNTLYEYVHRELSARTRQIPQRHFDHAIGDVMLARARRGDGSTAAPPEAPVVEARVPRPRLQLSMSDLDFGIVAFGTPSPVLRVELRNIGDGQLDARARTEQPWLLLHHAGQSLDVSVDSTWEGDLAGAIRIESRGGGASILVAARVARGPLLKIPKRIDLGRVLAREQPKVVVPVRNDGVGDLDWSIAPSAGFFTARRTDGGVEIRPKDWLAPGQHRGVLRITSDGGDAEIEVTATVVSYGYRRGAVAWRPPPLVGRIAALLLVVLVALTGLAVGVSRMNLFVQAPPTPAPTPVAASTPPVVPHAGPGPIAGVARQGTLIDLFWIDPVGRFTTGYFDGSGNWIPPTQLSPESTADRTSAVAGVAPHPDRLAVAWRLDGGRGLGWSTFDPQRKWSQPMQLTSDNPVRSGSPIAAVARTEDEISVFWVGEDGALYTVPADATRRTHGEPVVVAGGNAVAAGSNLAVVAFSPSPRRTTIMRIVWIRSDLSVVAASSSDGGSHWRQDAILGQGADPASGVAAAALTTRDHVEAFWVSGGSLLTAAADGGRWERQSHMVPGTVAPGSSLAAVTSIARVDVYWVDGTGAVQTNGDQPLTCSAPPPGSIRPGLVAFSHPSGQVDVAWVTDDGRIAGCFPGMRFPAQPDPAEAFPNTHSVQVYGD